MDATKGGSVTSLVISGGVVYAGGYSTNSLGVIVPGYWKDGMWHGLTPVDATKTAVVSSLVIIEP